MNLSSLERTEEFNAALARMEGTDSHLFLTGKAGTGKSTLLEYFVRTTKKRAVVLAPTGVAALNVGGETIHSFFGFRPGVTLEKVRRVRGARQVLYLRLATIVIDEISMVRADLLDCVDAFLRLNGPDPASPFGGVQMIFIGDLYQLPPVVSDAEKEAFAHSYESPYFFSARALRGLPMEFLELEKIYRQKDERFIALLNGIRTNTIAERDLQSLNRSTAGHAGSAPAYRVYLSTTNRKAAEINAGRLALLPGEDEVFAARVDGEFGEKYYPADGELRLRQGAQVMLLANDPAGRWVNGSIGKVLDFERDTARDRDRIIVELTDGSIVDVAPHTWEVCRYTVSEETGAIASETAGHFVQYPLKLAWAVTIHKSQGKTFDNVVIDLGSGTFAHGQAYVALSRCTSLAGITLTTPLKKEHIIMDPRIVRFMTGYQRPGAPDSPAVEETRRIIQEAIDGRGSVEIVYLKPGNEKSTRVIRPHRVGEMEHAGASFLGIAAFCTKANAHRTFRLDRILEVRHVD